MFGLIATSHLTLVLSFISEVGTSETSSCSRKACRPFQKCSSVEIDESARFLILVLVLQSTGCDRCCLIHIFSRDWLIWVCSLLCRCDVDLRLASSCFCMMFLHSSLDALFFKNRLNLSVSVFEWVSVSKSVEPKDNQQLSPSLSPESPTRSHSQFSHSYPPPPPSALKFAFSLLSFCFFLSFPRLSVLSIFVFVLSLSPCSCLACLASSLFELWGWPSGDQKTLLFNPRVWVAFWGVLHRPKKKSNKHTRMCGGNFKRDLLAQA